MAQAEQRQTIKGALMALPLALYFSLNLAWGFVWPNLLGATFFLSDLFVHAIAPALVLWCYVANWGIPFRSFYRSDSNSQKVGTTWLEFIGLAALLSLFELGIDGVSVGIGRAIAARFPEILPSIHSYASRGPRDAGGHLLTAVYYSATAAFFEEIIYRGAIYRIATAVAPQMRPAVILLVMSVPDAILHFSHGLASSIEATIGALLSAIAYRAIGDLRPVIVAHFMVDIRWFY